jgi:hypothetical protein
MEVGSKWLSRTSGNKQWSGYCRLSSAFRAYQPCTLERPETNAAAAQNVNIE